MWPLHLPFLLLVVFAVVRINALLMFPQVEHQDACLKAMCQVDSSCVPKGCSEDANGRVGCGYFRLNIYSFRHCYQPGKETDEEEEEAWMRCAEDFDCSQGCLRRLANRYKLKCYGKSDCEIMARIHQGGANGCRSMDTMPYWNRVRQRCPSCTQRLI